MREVTLAAQPLARYAPLVGDDEFKVYQDIAEAAQERFHGRVIWNVSSTARGGGVAEMLRALLPYVRGVGVDMRWLVLDGSADFFRVTKRIHHALHGAAGDGSELGAGARATYERVLRDEAEDLLLQVRSRDTALLHDPQAAGLAPALIARGARVIWRCHIGHDQRNDETNRGWAFLQPYLRDVDGFVFSRAAFVPGFCAPERTAIIHPSIDPFSPKNQPMDDAAVRAILREAGIIDGELAPTSPLYVREDGSPGRVTRHASVSNTPAPHDAPLVVQVSRWDDLKDHPGVIRGFVRMIETGRGDAAHLMVAGPDVAAVADDPEGRAAYASTLQLYSGLTPAHRERIHVASLPMEDAEENAAIVNALQRHASVIVQKSLAEGFGLTVTEAMAKGRPLVASAVGGIQEQVEDGVHGLLLRDPRDLDDFASLVASLLDDRTRAVALGEGARERALREFTGLQALRRYAELMTAVDIAADRNHSVRGFIVRVLRAARSRIAIK